MVWIGIKPAVFFDIIEEPVNYIVRKVDPTYFDKQTDRRIRRPRP